MTDYELIEAAARAAGLTEAIFYEACPEDGEPFAYARVAKRTYWRPLGDDGDALRLAAKLGLTIEMPEGGDATAYLPGSDVVAVEWAGLDPDAMLPAVRRAVVRAAAALAPTPSDSSHA